MSPVLIIIIIVIWSVVRAVRQAQREQEAKAKLAARKAELPLPSQTTVDFASAPTVSSSSASDYESDAARWAALQAEAADFLAQSRTVAQEIVRPPEEVFDRPKRGRKPKRRAMQQTQQNDEVVERLVEPAPTALRASTDAYEQGTVRARRRISLDKESLRTFFVTREVLGPPRSRAPHHRRNRQ